MVLICIAGLSGGGKTTLSTIMEKYLPNAFNVRKIEDEFFLIKDREALEIEYGVPVPVDIENEKDYLREVAKAHPNSEKKFFELLLPLAEKNINKAIVYVAETHAPDYIIIEGVNMPSSPYWTKADYRIIVEPTSFELLVEFVKKRHEKQPYVDETLARQRYLAVEVILNNAINVDYRIRNNYDQVFEQEAKTVCDDIIRHNTFM